MGLNLGDIREMVTKLRSFHLTNYGRFHVRSPKRDVKRNIEFSLMSYNILSQDLLSGHPQLYHTSSELALKWPERGERIIRELRESSADVICLQEMHSVHYNDVYLPTLEKLGYSGVYKKRTGDKFDGCAMFVKKSAFTVDKSFDVEFCRRDIAKNLDRDNVALIAVLKPVENQNGEEWQLVVVTTHLLFNPKRGDIKLAQLRLLFAELHQITSNLKTKYHIIFCGDMNSEPLSPLYRFVRDGRISLSGVRSGDFSGQAEAVGAGRLFRNDDLQLNGITVSSVYEDSAVKSSKCSANGDSDSSCTVTHNFHFRSAYPNRDLSGNRFVSTFHSDCLSLVDYIFYSCSPQFKLIGYKKLLTNDTLSQIGCLPNEYLGSDHLSLLAKFVIIRNE